MIMVTCNETKKKIKEMHLESNGESSKNQEEQERKRERDEREIPGERGKTHSCPHFSIPHPCPSYQTSRVFL